MKSPSRPYRMTTRARAVEETRTRVLDATLALHEERLTANISLADVAGRAAVSVQTVLRHFGSREGLVEAALAHGAATVEDERRVEAGDVTAAVASVVAHYERRGDGVLLLLAQEGSEPFVRTVTDRGRAMHRNWVEASFGPLLPTARAERAEAVDLLVVATDVYTWKLLRRDGGLAVGRTRARIESLVRAVLALHAGLSGPQT